jgi:hypothetical protein
MQVKETVETVSIKCGAPHISAGAHRTDKKKQSDSLREDVRLLVSSVAYSISMLCGCLAFVITKLNHQVKCQRCVSEIGTVIFFPKNLVVVINNELCREAVTLVDRYKEDILKNFMLSFCVRDNTSSSLYKTVNIRSNWERYCDISR